MPCRSCFSGLASLLSDPRCPDGVLPAREISLNQPNDKPDHDLFWGNDGSVEAGDHGIPKPNGAQDTLVRIDMASGGGATEVLSRRQQKKQIVRDVKRQRKGQKKTQKQVDALEAALALLEELIGELPPLAVNFADQSCKLSQSELRVTNGCARQLQNTFDGRHALAARVLEVFNVESDYSNLPCAYGPSPAEGLPLLGSVLIRPPKYTAKFLPQEYSLLHKLWSLLGGDCRRAGVVDVGAGNANCAVLAASLLGLTVICVERESPRIELRAEAQLPAHFRSRVVRLETDIENFDSTSLASVAAEHGFDRVVLIAKHPCGIGVDRSIDCTTRLRAGCVTVAGVVIATCCANKISFDDFRVSRVPEFCSLYSLRDSCCPMESSMLVGEVASSPARASLERAVELMSRCSAWRTAAGSLGNAIHENQVRWAELFEDALQQLRVQRLRNLFGNAAQLRFAPPECTLQDRCLVASLSPLPSGIWAHGEKAIDSSFIEQLRLASATLLSDSGPIDCRPNGIRSARYDFDYTAGLSDAEPADE